MRYLSIDEQTIDDLAIFGKHGKPSIFELYNKTVTQGGSLRLEDLFRHPFADEHYINEKAQIFKCFSLKEYRFPVESETISTVAFYIDNQDVRTQLQIGSQSVGQLLKDMVAADADYVFVRDGILATLRMFHKLNLFIEEIPADVKQSAYGPIYIILKDLIDDPDFSGIRQLIGFKTDYKLSATTLAELDKVVRFEQRDKILQLLELLYDLDVIIAVGQVARKSGFHFAKVLPASESRISCKQLYHPHVVGAIANNLEFNTAHNVLFLTGANMAGKSTLMKSIGVALYLAHMGFPVAAHEFIFAVRDGIVTSINLADNLNMGASHYYAEVLRVKEVAMQLKQGRQLFVIFDELFRGTNVKDAYDATIAITAAFSNKTGSQFIISTHIMEAGEVLQQKSIPVRFQYLPTNMQGNIPTYTRILRDGITADRQGMIIIQNEGILEMLDTGLKEYY